MIFLNKLILKISKFALNKIQEHLKKNIKLKFRIYIEGGGCSGFKYGFIFDNIINNDDIIFIYNNIVILIDFISIQYLKNSKIDYIETFKESKFLINNPNAKLTCSCGSSFALK